MQLWSGEGNYYIFKGSNVDFEILVSLLIICLCRCGGGVGREEWGLLLKERFCSLLKGFK